MQGSYNNYECGLAISDAEAADDGDWSCEFESYVRNGKRGDGTLASVSGGLAVWYRAGNERLRSFPIKEKASTSTY